MYFTSSAIIAITALASFAAAQNEGPKLNLCKKDVLPDGWVAGKVEAPLIQESSFQQLNGAAQLKCSGTVVILDGCTNALQTKWYGGVVGTDAAGNIVENDLAVNLAGDVIPSNGMDSQKYSLFTDPSIAYSFFSINEIRVFDVVNQQRVCRAELPNRNPRVTGAAPAPGSTSTATVTGSTGSTNKPSGAQSIFAGSIAALLAPIAAALAL
ncbi:hypothetical protein HDU97_005185 [Phlyctochytrium planicorne]|nr:hypothetical protein HDU97_005185 [Phlyctochytrium planicorne]